MRACIVTLVGMFNHGNRLQNYALTQVLRSMGYAVSTYGSTYRPPLQSAKWHLRKLIGKPRDPNITQHPNRLNLFEEFNQTLDVHRVSHMPHSLSEEYDVFIVGSDQVWNPYFVHDRDAYFLKFAPQSKRVAYAASFGTSEIPGNLVNAYRNGLSHMRSVSVRESEGACIVSDLAGFTPPTTLDPTMLLNHSSWEAVEERPHIEGIDAPFLFKYVLGKDVCGEDIACMARERSLNVIDIADSAVPIGPRQFVWLANHAELTCTDSFHASVFSLMAHTPIILYDRVGSHSDMSSRFVTLFETLGVSSQLALPSQANACYEQWDWDAIDAHVQEARKKSLAWLTEAVHE